MPIYRIPQLYPEERKIVRSITAGPGLSALTPIVSALVPLDSNESKRPLRLKLPRELDKAIRDVVGEGGKKTGFGFSAVLLQAAHRYRKTYPLPEGWEEPDEGEYGKAERKRREKEDDKLERKPIVLRLDKEDRKLLRDLGRGRKKFITRHGALCELVEIVEGMHKKGEFDRICQRIRRPIRIAIPEDLDAAIREKIGESRSYIPTLLAAAREYERQNDAMTE